MIKHSCSCLVYCTYIQYGLEFIHTYHLKEFPCKRVYNNCVQQCCKSNCIYSFSQSPVIRTSFSQSPVVHRRKAQTNTKTKPEVRHGVAFICIRFLSCTIRHCLFKLRCKQKFESKFVRFSQTFFRQKPLPRRQTDWRAC